MIKNDEKIGEPRKIDTGFARKKKHGFTSKGMKGKG